MPSKTVQFLILLICVLAEGINSYNSWINNHPQTWKEAFSEQKNNKLILGDELNNIQNSVYNSESKKFSNTIFKSSYPETPVKRVKRQSQHHSRSRRQGLLPSEEENGKLR